MGEIRLPPVKYSYENMKEAQNTQMWFHLMPYIMEPYNEARRRKISLVLCAYHKMNLANSLKKSEHNVGVISRIVNRVVFEYEERRYQQLGGSDGLISAPPLQVIKEEFKKNIKKYHTVYSILWFFFRLAEDKNGKVWPGLKQARALVRACDPTQGSLILPYRSQKDIDRVFSQLRPAAHLIFGLVAQSPNIKFFKPENAANILRVAAFAQNKLTTISLRNTDLKSAYSENDLHMVPMLEGLEPMRPDLPPLSDREIVAFCRNVEKEWKKPPKEAHSDPAPDRSTSTDIAPPAHVMETIDGGEQPPSLEGRE